MKMHKLSFIARPWATNMGLTSFSIMKTFLDIVTDWALGLGDTHMLLTPTSAGTPFAAFLTGIGFLLLAHPSGQGAHYLSPLAPELGMSFQSTFKWLPSLLWKGGKGPQGKGDGRGTGGREDSGLQIQGMRMVGGKGSSYSAGSEYK